MTRRSTITAAVVAAVLGLAAAGCGSGDRQDVNQSNEGVLDPQGGSSTQQDPNSGLTPTGETQPSVTQPEGG
jgi:hypothetical protein